MWREGEREAGKVRQREEGGSERRIGKVEFAEAVWRLVSNDAWRQISGGLSCGRKILLVCMSSEGRTGIGGKQFIEKYF